LSGAREGSQIILFRHFEKRTSLVVGPGALSAEELIELEFLDDNRRPDLEISVYEVEEHLWCSVCLQKMACAGADPPRYAGGIDVKPIRSDVEHAPESYPFRLISETHRVLRIGSEADLLSFVRAVRAAMDSGACVPYKRDKNALRGWLHINRNDPEWASWLRDASEKWRKFPQAEAAS